MTSRGGRGDASLSALASGDPIGYRFLAEPSHLPRQRTRWCEIDCAMRLQPASDSSSFVLHLPFPIRHGRGSTSGNNPAASATRIRPYLLLEIPPATMREGRCPSVCLRSHSVVKRDPSRFGHGRTERPVPPPLRGGSRRGRRGTLDEPRDDRVVWRRLRAGDARDEDLHRENSDGLEILMNRRQRRQAVA